MCTGKLPFLLGLVVVLISIVIYHQVYEGDRYVFLVEWYDMEASLTRSYNLFYFTADDTVELYDLKNERTFLKRTTCDGVHLDLLYPGGAVKIYSRLVRIVDYGDVHTSSTLQAVHERTFAMIKPDAVEKMGKILQMILEANFRIINLKMARMTKEHAATFYQEHEGRPFYPFLLDYMTSGPVIAMELMSLDAITRWRELIGPTDSEKAREMAPDSLRAQFGKDKSYNAVHGSTSPEGVQLEASLFFPTDPILKRRTPSTTATFKDCTCCVIKPHAVKEGLVGEIILFLQEKGFNVTALQMLYLDQLQAEAFLEVYKGVVPEYPGMVSQLIDGPCVVLEVTGNPGDGENVVQKLRELVGPTNPEHAKILKPDTLRALYGKSNLENVVHCTDLPEDGLLDVQYFFELLESGQKPELTDE